MEENKQILELLQRIERSSRRRTVTGIFQCVFMLAAAGCCVVLFAEFIKVLPQIYAVIGQMEAVLGNLEQATQQIASIDLQSMVSDMDALVITGQQSLEQTMAKLDTIDFETLNKAIRNLAAVVEPIAKFFKVLG